jgi:hypothetical protein
MSCEVPQSKSYWTMAVSDCLRLSQAVSDCLRHSAAVCHGTKRHVGLAKQTDYAVWY